jgi:hypothetical protein
MRPKMNPKELSTFFLLVFVSQLFLMTLVSFSLDSTIASIDTEQTSDGDFSDELDADEGDFSLLLEEELDKNYRSNSELNLFFPKNSKVYFNYIHSKSRKSLFQHHLPPEYVS